MTSEGLPPDGDVIVVGASLAGWRAVETLRAEGFEGDITLVGEELHLPYDRPPLVQAGPGRDLAAREGGPGRSQASR